MVNSRNIDDLRPDVAANAKLWLAECRVKGLDVEISNTVRDNEYQAYVDPKYWNGKMIHLEAGG